MQTPPSQIPDLESGGSPQVAGQRLENDALVSEVVFAILDIDRSPDGESYCVAALPVRGGKAEPGKLRSWHHLPTDNLKPATAAEIRDTFAGTALVFHEDRDDVLLLDGQLSQTLGKGLPHPRIDTALLATKLIEPASMTFPPSLDGICHHLALPAWARHTTEGDSFATAQLFLILCARLRRMLGRPLVLGDLLSS